MVFAWKQVIARNIDENTNTRSYIAQKQMVPGEQSPHQKIRGESNTQKNRYEAWEMFGEERNKDGSNSLQLMNVFFRICTQKKTTFFHFLFLIFSSIKSTWRLQKRGFKRNLKILVLFEFRKLW